MIMVITTITVIKVIINFTALFGLIVFMVSFFA